MKWGLAFASSIGVDGDSALEICRRAEEVGFESVWGGEHVVLPTTIESAYPYSHDGKIPAQPETPIPDPLIWLAFVAAAAPTLRLGTCILIVPQRNPLVLAKEIATLGVPWDRRGPRNDEYVVRIADGYFPGERGPARLGALIADLRVAAEKHGRDPNEIEINAMFGIPEGDPAERAEQLRARGVGRIMVPAFFFAGPGGLDRLSELAERVIEPVVGAVDP